MPKLLVLFDASTDDIAHLADAVAEGARGVRFAEVDVRRLAGAPGGDTPDTPDARVRLAARYRVLDDADALATYDGIVIGAGPGDGAGAVLSAVASSLVNKVGSAFAPESAERSAQLQAALVAMADREMILVPTPFAAIGASRLEEARRQGKRMAEVVGYITHARSHHHHH